MTKSRGIRFRGTVAERLIHNSRLDPVKGCRLWLGSRIPHNQMAQISINGRPVLIHRASYEEFVGPIPDGLKVLHKCDVPFCIEPDHLFLGTQKDNVHDCMNKGRRAKIDSEKWPSAKLTWEKVREIRASPEGYSALARKYGVYPNAIKCIKLNTSWKEKQ